MKKINREFKILSIDGGGFRGIYTAHILSKIEKEFKINWLESFDLVAGTSTGSIIAAGLVCGFSAGELVGFYKTNGRKIFAKNWLHPLGLGLSGSKYKHNPLKTILKEKFSNKKLGEIDFPLIIPATDVSNGCLHVFKSHYHDDFIRDTNVLVSDAIMASCSAPTYFDPFFCSENLMADGGLWANDPSLVATIDAKCRLNQELLNVRILSIGTGCSKKYYSLKNSWWQKLLGWGFLTRWGRGKFIDMLLNLQSQSTQNQLRLLLQNEQILRLNFESDHQLPLDDVSQAKQLISIADHDFSHRSAEIKTFLNIQEE